MILAVNYNSLRGPRWAPVTGGLGCIVLLSAAISGCASTGGANNGHSQGTARRASAAVVVGSVAIERDSWEYHGREGQLLATSNYSLHTTVDDHYLLRRLPAFMESALVHYRTALADLAGPDEVMETYLFGKRSEWESFTRDQMGDRAAAYLLIGRGGFATKGTAILFDIGAYDTMAIAAHEGWHQYTQSCFGDHLPVWIEEGIAAYMEGHRNGPRGPLFLPWANIERFDQLRVAARLGRLIPLTDLLAATPQGLLEHSRHDVLTYYAQVWALVHFLHEGESGKYRQRLEQLLTDAHAGRLHRRVLATLEQRYARPGDIPGGSGSAVLLAYFTDDLNTLEREFRQFVRQVTATGARQRVRRGASPLPASDPDG